MVSYGIKLHEAAEKLKKREMDAILDFCTVWMLLMPKERVSISITKPSIPNTPPGDRENSNLAPRIGNHLLGNSN